MNQIKELFQNDALAEESVWAAGTFSDKMVCALPLTSNRKQFRKLSKEETAAFLDTMTSHFVLLNDLKGKVKGKDICFPDLILYLDQIMEQNACSFVRVVYERVVFAGQGSTLCNEEPFEDFMRRYVFLLNPSVKQHQADQLWLEYFDKYLLMTKELVLTCLRNASR